MNSSAKYRSRSIERHVIAFSISHDEQELLARGLGIEHMRDLLLRLARPFLRQGASLAYGGHWTEGPTNFTYDLLRLIKAEQEDQALATSDVSQPLGILYNHTAWPDYRAITTEIEARWINCCRIVRTQQADAGISPESVIPDDDETASDARLWNRALCLSAMRQRMTEAHSVAVADLFYTEAIPPVNARILLGGKLHAYQGFMPGIFEETLNSLVQQQPTYLLGGFGGATTALAQALLEPKLPASATQKALKASLPANLTLTYHRAHTPAVSKLFELAKTLPRPALIRDPEQSYAELAKHLVAARANLSKALKTGLDETETRELLSTQDVNHAIWLVKKGMKNQFHLIKYAE